MVRRLQDRFGTAGLVIAVIALVAALTGTALAANAALSSKQKKEVTKIAKKYAGKPGPAGPQGAAGSNGAPGAAGKDGAPGVNGINGKSVVVTNENPIGCAEGGVTYEVAGSGQQNEVCNGTNGQTGFTDTLPPSKTETGMWAIHTGPNEIAPGEHQEIGVSPISFTIPLATAPAPVFLFKGETSKPGCPGIVDGVPTADEGKLCVYTAFASGPLQEPSPGLKYAFISGPQGVNEFEVAAKTGALVNLGCAASQCNWAGTWAVTAGS